MSHLYYYTSSGEMIGPLSPAVVRELVQQGIITRNTVLENSEGKTSVAEKVKGLTFPEVTSAAAVPPSVTVPPVSVPPSAKPSKPKRKSYKGVAIALLVVGILLSAYIFRDSIATIAPGLGESMTGYRRGFGDTILTYKNRSYAGAKWEEVKISHLNDDDNNPYFYCIAGWEDEDYWIVSSKNINLFRCKNGTWTNPYRQDQSSYSEGFAIPFDKNSMLVSWIMGDSAGGTRLFREDGTNIKLPNTYGRACYVDNGLLYVVNCRWESGNFSHKISFTNVDTLGDKSTKYEKITDTDNAYFVHTKDNIVMRASVKDLDNFVSVAPGKCFATVDNILVEFRNGIWYKIEELPNHRYPSKSMWIDCVGTTPKHAVLVSDEGRVVIHQFGESYREIQVPQPQETTSMELFRVWGNNINKFWTMDTNGTIWEKAGNDWRVVVRGLRKDDITFEDAWVSPTGTIYAITDKKLYQLK